MAELSGPVGGRRTSSASLSSPPMSPKSPVDGDSIVVSAGPSDQQTSSTTTQAPAKIEPPAKPKRVRKPKIAADGTEITPKPRKPRAKKKDVETASATTTPASTSKAPAVSQAPVLAPAKPSRQSKISDLMSPVPVVQDSTNVETRPIRNVDVTIQNTNSVPIERSTPNSAQQPQQSSAIQANNGQTILSPSIQPLQPSSIPTSRGQSYYDPIRSSTITAPPRSLPTPTTPIQPAQAKSAVRASTSPSIASLMNPSSTSETPFSRPPSSLSPIRPLPPQLVQPTEAPATQSASPSTSVIMPRTKPPTPPVVDAMDIDVKAASMSRTVSTSNNSAPSPAPSKLKEKLSLPTPKLPPLPGQGFESTKESGVKAIIIDVPLQGENYKYINFQRLAVEKYGYNAVYPKLALQREHLARVAANAAALERKNGPTTSNDEMSIDGSEDEAELSTGSKRKAPDDAEEPAKKKRLTYEDKYDPEDDFIDDTEAAWEQTAAAVQDGFFVYSGSLVPTEEPKADKPEGTAPKRKPRTSKPAASKATATKTTKTDEEKKDPKTTTTNGTKEPAPKKPAAPRKRYTKEEQAQRKIEAEAKKAEKERLAAEKAAASGKATTSTTSNEVSPGSTAVAIQPAPVASSA